MEKMSIKQIKTKAIEMQVDISWAIECKKIYINQIINELKTSITEDIAFINKCLFSLGRALTLQRIEKQKKEIEKIKNYLHYLEIPFSEKITNQDIENAKNYPIRKLLPHSVKKNMTRCPFHNDKHPSMGIKYNKVRCFACNKTWDSIALVMQLKKTNFVDAIKYLRRI